MQTGVRVLRRSPEVVSMSFDLGYRVRQQGSPQIKYCGKPFVGPTTNAQGLKAFRWIFCRTQFWRLPMKRKRYIRHPWRLQSRARGLQMQIVLERCKRRESTNLWMT